MFYLFFTYYMLKYWDTASGSNDTDDQSSIIIDRMSILDKTTPSNSPNIGVQYLPLPTK